MCASKSVDGNWYRSRIQSVDTNDLVTVFNIDYGNTEQVKATQLKQLKKDFCVNLSANVMEINLPIRVPLDSDKAKKNADMLQDKLKDLTYERSYKLHVIELRKNHIIGDLYNESNISLLSLLDKQLDVNYMRKQLDKETSVYEYFETVDLTAEEDMAMEDKKLKAKLASPNKKKAKANINAEETKSNKNEATVQAVEKPTILLEQQNIIVAEPLPPAEPIEQNISIEISDTSQTEIKAVEEEEVEEDIYAGMEKAILSHCDNPAQFFMHSIEGAEALRKLQENLQIIAPSLPPLMGLHTDSHCISQYSVDKQWYRARIVDAELMMLKFIDFGNTDCVSDASELREMCAYQNIEPLCKPYALPIKPNCTLEWVDAANNIFNESFDKVLHYEYITHGDKEKRSFIKLFVDGINVADKLVQDGYAKPMEIVESDENCYTSHVNGITDFYIQYEKNSKALELIEMYLSENVQQLKPIEHFEKYRIVAALFADDEMWYRAKLLKQLSDGKYEVLFIDYGNTSSTAECRDISAEIAHVPALSKRCTLQLPEECVSWSDAAEEKFAEIAAQGETIFTVELCEPRNDCAAVHLYIDGRNINEDLSPLCEQKVLEDEEAAYNLNRSLCNTTLHSSFGDAPVGTIFECSVSAVHNIDNFYVHFNKEQERLQDMANSLQSLAKDARIIKNSEFYDVVGARISVNKVEKLYRANILEVFRDSKNQPVKWRVFLLDYGTEHHTTELCALPAGLVQVNALAKQCQLYLTDELQHEDPNKLLIAFNAALKEDCQWNIELIHNELTPAVVKLFDAKSKQNICEKMLQNMPATVRPTVTSVVKNEQCLISHVLTPTHFYIQLKSKLAEMEYVSKALNQTKTKMFDKFSNPIVNDLCCAYVAEEDLYYRAKVISLNEETIQVQLIDQGYIISCKELYVLPYELINMPALAEKCAIKDLPLAAYEQHQHLWNVQFQALVDAHFAEFYEIEAMEKGEDVTKIKLLVNFDNVVECLSKAVDVALKCGMAEEVATDVLTPLRAVLHDCGIIHVNSPHDFYIQLSEVVPTLQDITDKLLDAENDFEPVTCSLAVGSLCAALFPDDEVYYRARILQRLDNNKYEVHYIDFGNNAITDKVLELPDDMKKLAACAQNCSLHDLPDTLTIEICEQFQELVDARFTETFQVELLKTTVKPQICRIYFNQRNMATEIMDMLKQNGYNGYNSAHEGEQENI